jgi:hypothetical protein
MPRNAKKDRLSESLTRAKETIPQRADSGNSERLFDPFLGSLMAFHAYEAIRNQPEFRRLARELKL